MFRRLLELVFPSNIYCMACGAIIDRSRPYSLCDSCLSELHWVNGRSCERCGKALGADYDGELCPDCEDMEHYFDKGVICLEYGMHEREMILSYKYGGRAYMGEKFADMMYDKLAYEGLAYRGRGNGAVSARKRTDAFDLVVPVPVHKSKLKKRGYNQAQLMAAALAEKLGLLCASEVLVKVKHVDSMSHLNAAERRENIKNSFTMAAGQGKIVKDRRILLVDDVYTTGSTVDECGRVLLEAGARSVSIICLAAGTAYRTREEG